MYCGFCGAENEDGSVFCCECGKKIITEEVEESREYVKKSSVKKYILLFAAIVALVICFLGIMIRNNSSKQNGCYSRRTSTEAVVVREDDVSTAYAILSNGELITIEDAKYCKITPDQSHIIYSNSDNISYITNPKLSGKDRLGELEGVLSIYDDILIFRDTDGIYRYDFKKGSETKLSESKSNSDFCVYEKNGNILYADKNMVCRLSSSSDQIEVLHKKAGVSFTPLYISDDSQTTFWYEQSEMAAADETTYTVCTYKNDDAEEICTFVVEPSSKHPKCYTNATEAYFIISCENSGLLYVVPKNGKPIEIQVGDEYYRDCFYTRRGLLADDKGKFDGLYLAKKDDNGGDKLYFLDKNGNKEKVVSGVQDWSVNNGYLYYLEDDKDLICAKLKGCEMSDKKTIDKDISVFWEINGYIYYQKEKDENGEYTSLYVAKGNSEPERITSECYYESIMANESGDTVYFYKDYEEDSNTGTLYKFRYGKKDVERISDSVIYSSPTSGHFEKSILDDDSIIYKKRTSKRQYDLIFYNGKKSIIKVQDLTE